MIELPGGTLIDWLGSCLLLAILAGFLGYGIWREQRIRRSRPRFPPHSCQSCGYNLTGNISGQCPECGNEIGPSALARIAPEGAANGTAGFESLTDDARMVMEQASREARSLDHDYIGTEHILLGLLAKGGAESDLLKAAGVNVQRVRMVAAQATQRGSRMFASQDPPTTPRAREVIEYALEAAQRLNHGRVGAAHLFLSLLREPDGSATQILLKLGIDIERVHTEVRGLLCGGNDAVRQPEGKS